MNLVVLAFDGLARTDIERTGMALEEFKDDDYFEHTGSIDLGDRPFYFTSELFTDLITGETKKEHGVEGLRKFTDGKLGFNPTKLENWLHRNMKEFFFDGIPILGFAGPRILKRGVRNSIYQALGCEHIKWERTDILKPTLFDKYPEQVFQGQMPVYDWRLDQPLKHIKEEDRGFDRCVKHVEQAFVTSKSKFRQKFASIDWSSENTKVYIHHFHYVDWLQHLYDTKDRDNRTERMSSAWWDVNEFLQEVKEMLQEHEQEFELMVMSDHGWPDKYLGHEPDAYIASTNQFYPDNPTLQDLNEWIEWRL